MSMFRMVCALTISLALTSCAFGTWGTRGTLPTLVINKEYLVKCPRDLPELKQGDKESVQLNHKAVQEQYHRCANKDDALVDELIKQGVKGR